MSSSPTRIRSARITRIVAWADGENLQIDQSGAYDRLLKKANELWPELKFKTRESYAKSAYRFLEIAAPRYGRRDMSKVQT